MDFDMHLAWDPTTGPVAGAVAQVFSADDTAAAG